MVNDGEIMTHTKILELIENVDVNDSAALDEIDARVWCYKENIPYLSHSYNDMGVWIENEEGKECYVKNYLTINYTRSRDALKAIRPSDPKNFFVTIGQDYCTSWQCDIEWNESEFQAVASTEELAELSAIIQAIAHERSNL